jgi:hypothetical protein
MQALEDHRLRRDLVTVRRDDIDDRGIQGYILAVSEQLVALQYVADLRLDGLMILRTADITDVDCTATDRFQKTLLMRDGVEQAVAFEMTFDLGDWRSAIARLAREHPLMILECETPGQSDFSIGRVHTISETTVDFEYFSGAANWSEHLTEITLDEITSCQVDNSYLNAYRRHFERLALS